MKNYLLFAALLLLGLATGCKKDDNGGGNDEASVITPGVGISNLKIGDAAQVAIDLFGTTSASSGSVNGQYTHFLIYFSKGVTVYCETTTESVFNAQMKIASISLSAPYDGKTDKKIGIGSTKAEVKAAYGDPDSSSAFFGDKYDIGITFVYDDADEKVETIEIDQ